MNQWVKFHKEVLREERREAALAARPRNSATTPADAVARAEQPTGRTSEAAVPRD